MTNLFIFDFDDTLFPSYCYVNHSLKYNDIELFLKIDLIIFNLLTYVSSYGKIIILSDGDSGWLKEVISHLPNTKKFIRHNIPVLSTVVYYSELNRKDVINYKYNFIINNIKIRNHKQIILVGDGPSEKLASQKLMKQFNNIKHVEFMYQPTLNDWKNEIMFLYNNLIEILNVKERNIILTLNKK